MLVHLITLFATLSHLDHKIHYIHRLGTHFRSAPLYTPVLEMDGNIRVGVRHPSILISRVRLPLMLTLCKTMLIQTSINWIGGRTFAGRK